MNETVAQGVLIGVLCPVAASVVVIASMLGAKRETTTAYTIVGNLMVAIIAPVYFSFIGSHQDMSFMDSFLLILSKISPVIALPFFVALALQIFTLFLTIPHKIDRPCSFIHFQHLLHMPGAFRDPVFKISLIIV